MRRAPSLILTALGRHLSISSGLQLTMNSLQGARGPSCSLVSGGTARPSAAGSNCVPVFMRPLCSLPPQHAAMATSNMAGGPQKRVELPSTLAALTGVSHLNAWHRTRSRPLSRNVTAAATAEATYSTNGVDALSGSSSQYVLVTGAYVLPHPEKMAKGGEDWFFVSDSMRSIGVADGVGGWSEVGVDAGAYARQLMGHAKSHADILTKSDGSEYKQLVKSLNPASSKSPEIDVSHGSQAMQLQQTILEKAYSKTQVRGSSTACVMVLAGDRVLASNLGDSGFLLIRNGEVVFHSPQQQHDFNFPFQIGSVDSMSDAPSSAQRFELVVQPGDVLVLGTDGLWDNCFDEEIMSVIRYCQDVSMPMDKTAQVLAHYARHRASDPKFASPFAYAAFQAGFAYMGGKMDDITVVISRVAQAAEVADNPLPGLGGNDFTLPGQQSKL